MDGCTETQADVAFTLWLATRDRKTVLAERHAHMTKPEQQILAHHMRERVPQKLPPKPKQQFTRQQIDIALAALAAQDNRKAS